MYVYGCPTAIAKRYGRSTCQLGKNLFSFKKLNAMRFMNVLVVFLFRSLINILSTCQFVFLTEPIFERVTPDRYIYILYYICLYYIYIHMYTHFLLCKYFVAISVVSIEGNEVDKLVPTLLLFKKAYPVLKTVL